MGIFASILDRLGIGSARTATPRHRPAATVPAFRTPGGRGVAPAPRPAVPPPPRAISEVDVMARLEQKSAASAEKLDWKTSIVDLLKLLGIDSSLAARKELADELGAPSTLADGSAEMNLWLHREVLRRVAANGGNIPTSLLD